ncbi:MAG: 1-deoxy-D-xylulose-5-phosphate reductoisomerase [Fusobacteriota bacterium]
MKRISILGSTGSIGQNGLKVIDNLEDCEVLALTANNNYKLLIKQIKKYNPRYICIGSDEGYRVLKDKFKNLKIYKGEKGLKKIGQLNETDILLTAVSGAVGLEATIEAIKREKRIALANKETMVAAGPLIKKLLKEYDAEIIPVDSEHSAIYQSLKSGKISEVERLIVTASGGPFRGMSTGDLKKVTLEDALKHPNWSMGSKITIDSASMVNKGLEVIEAHYLFGIDYDDIDVVVHPESIIHSLVEFKDRSTITQMGVPDMKVPIQYAFTYPNREKNSQTESLNLGKIAKLTFEEPELSVFKGLKYAYEAGKIGKSMPIVFNAANEVAVNKFLNKEIKFLNIYEIIRKTMDKHKLSEINSVKDIQRVDKWTRQLASEMAISKNN